MVRLGSRRQCLELTAFVATFQLMLTLFTVWMHYDNTLPTQITLDAVNNAASPLDAVNNAFSPTSAPLVSTPDPSPFEDELTDELRIEDITNNELITTTTTTASSPLAQLPLDIDLEVDVLASSFDPYKGHMDNSRNFKTKMFAVSGSHWSELSSNRQVCLGAQTSLDRVYWVLETVRNWSGPISIALFTPEHEYHLALVFIKFLRMCYPQVREQVSFHFTYPVDHPAQWLEVDLRSSWPDTTNCEYPTEFLRWLLALRSAEMMKWREEFAYPQNLLRNQAKSGCQTEFTFIPDIDMIPKPRLDLEMETFLQTDQAKNCSLCAFVVPTYEILSKVEMLPKDKSELLKLIKRQEARQFHIVVYKPNQASSQLQERWEKMDMTDEMELGYKIAKYQFRYEPLYFSRAKDTPNFDERFVGFGMTRNTQSYEMFVKGFEFWVMSNAFTSHWGFQTTKSRPKWRARQQERNNKKFDVFAAELYARYGRDPYDMMSKLKKLNLKNIKVAYGQ